MAREGHQSQNIRVLVSELELCVRVNQLRFEFCST